MGIHPPDPVGDVVDSEAIRPAQLLCDHFSLVRSIHSDPANVRAQTPVRPVHIAVNSNTILDFQYHP